MHSSRAVLPRAFYDRPVLEVARGLLGQVIHFRRDEQILRAAILETEAYDGEADQACHARRGRTPRVIPMYEEAGHAYIYFTYGMHWLLNAVTGAVGYPAAVLIRAAHPLEGIPSMAERREGQPFAHWCDGPAKLTRAFGIDGSLNTTDLCDPQNILKMETGYSVPDELVQNGPRIGLGKTPEPWLSLPWRFYIPQNTFAQWLETQGGV